ncbi:hypothetical protein J2Y67_002964 [Neobacillus niacini]|nr:hypothetical protein [Neobacillus niacini]
MNSTPRIHKKILKYSFLFKILGIINDQEFKEITGVDFLHADVKR